ncbi:hypothetical protein [Streptomyces sp. bgisy091]|uniref:hypothetical protein n=1 Tax=Streptomyces sp. bgisy091 TaxID=3413778 RepID=UPI003D75C29A
MKLTVCLNSAPDVPRVQVTMGDLRHPRGKFLPLFMVFLVIRDSSWFTDLHVSDPDVSAVRDRTSALEKVLLRSQGLRRLGGGFLPWMAHVLAQTFFLWFSISAAFESLYREGDTGALASGVITGGAMVIGWQMFAEWLARTRVRVAPTSGQWWQSLTANPGLSGAIGAAVGVLGLLVAIASAVITIMVS